LPRMRLKAHLWKVNEYQSRGKGNEDK
jgi:hypothetical protein